ncbi:MAG: 3-deoxy-8-phosphooctulonate synthase [Sphingobacteriia bacterium 24-36-13]|jgi:2-dehydro-3-deoxyphosphooctonate aldolase (KDO 8-P synthase)|uniref:3-deoxy-8-phosphooctulonate synthase n=1 Tax=Sediminibacterium sp. TaxID=1917865 RepID=UPI000BDACE36|nr:3-deoxy-8-phosphooctulonate synthase [Sediminibacterium sp.]OYY11234.1 MAG: 3-deoxy-8-phosphooctulonate synthase [Sphingobacteriia bacterium 35-36-14]OYZ53965.1 MAG: 3-deoxy-8-phosphooctulonate synthase [Sphingobacteriia bacterium 24-36-13]OZA64961.1 MAG: 3-deoxy-8-phosphooctulonate synthase [Sphingobacteriia bacterium 39-36-14]HQS25096.1 3-deoxy-8-phosphooctulonate synthase [Sediminibacterium sp.]HQS35728.1 3-deoxy-8-phosphooctulonate synthase [Sediminibacterium sp.]
MLPNFLQDLFKNQQYNPESFFLIAGPCVVESEEIVMEIADTVSNTCKQLGIPYVFKASYRKANRTSANSFTGIGDENGLSLIKKVGQKYGLPTTSDIHAHEEAAMAAPFIDILQIPAFLCRQTDLLEAAAITGKIVNVKKGQFLSGASMKFAVEKIQKAGNQQILLTERGNTFGYQDLVVDYRNIPIMQSHGTPVVMDCTHSLQQPNQTSGVTGGNPAMIGTIAKAAIATGALGLFIETHPNPAVAKSDGANMLALNLLPNLLEQLVKLREVVTKL